MILFPDELISYKKEVENALSRGQIATPSMLYTNPSELNDLTRNAKGRYNSYSIADKKLEDATIELNRVLKELDMELKDNRNRVKKLSGTANGVKYEVELRGLIGTLLNNKIAAIKSKVDIAVKGDNIKKTDIKLAMDLGGAGPAITNAVGDANSFISTMINTGNTTNDIYNFKSNISNVDSIKPTGVIRYNEVGEITNDPKGNINPPKTAVEVAEETKVKVEDVINDLVIPVKEEEPVVVEEVIQPIEHKQAASTITNALGEVVNIYDDNYLDDYIDDNNVDRSMKRSEAVLRAKMNPNVKIYFKYNQALDVGYLIAVDEEKMEELSNVTTLPLDLIYPWTINRNNNTVTTMIREEYPIIYTEDPLPKDIMDELEIIKSRPV